MVLRCAAPHRTKSMRAVAPLGPNQVVGSLSWTSGMVCGATRPARCRKAAKWGLMAPAERRGHCARDAASELAS
eukprot:5256724-Lingulodinium_polyedra.AAC.1